MKICQSRGAIMDFLVIVPKGLAHIFIKLYGMLHTYEKLQNALTIVSSYSECVHALGSFQRQGLFIQIKGS